MIFLYILWAFADLKNLIVRNKFINKLFIVSMNENIIPFTPKNYKKIEPQQKNAKDQNDIKDSKGKEENKKNDIKDKQQIYMNPINPLSNAFFFLSASIK